MPDTEYVENYLGVINQFMEGLTSDSHQDNTGIDVLVYDIEFAALQP